MSLSNERIFDIPGNGPIAPRNSDLLLDALERAVLKILEDPTSKNAEKLSAIANGTKLAAIRHSINGSHTVDGDFFAQ